MGASTGRPFPALDIAGTQKCALSPAVARSEEANPAGIASRTRSYATSDEVSYVVSWVAVGVGSQSGVPRHQRVCQLSGTRFGDEMHLVFECAAMADLCGRIPYTFQAHYTTMQTRVAANPVANCQGFRCRHV